MPSLLLDLLQNGLQTFLKLAAVLCTGNQSAHIQRKDLVILQTRPAHRPRTIRCASPSAIGGLANAGFTDQYRVVLRLTGQDTDHVADLRCHGRSPDPAYCSRARSTRS